MKKMKLTVIVTVFNIAEHLPRFFEAMKNQTYSDYVLLVLDDGSQDNSLKVCREYEKQDSRIKVIPCEHLGTSTIILPDTKSLSKSKSSLSPNLAYPFCAS